MNLLESDAPLNVYRANAAERFQQFIAYSGANAGKLLLVGADTHLLSEAERRGFEIHAFTPQQFEFAIDRELPGSIEACLIFCALERLKNPLSALQAVRRALTPRGSLMVISPTIDSSTAKLLRTSWWEFNETNRFYFSVDTLQNLLIKAGFTDPIISPDRSFVSLNYLRQRVTAHAQARRPYRWLPRIISLSPVLRNKPFRLMYGRTQFLVRSRETPSKPILSVIVPAYNERNTFVQLIDSLLTKTLEGIAIEVIIVESNSTDGTRELALKYKDHPRVQLILESRPRGKGHAVRVGLEAATGSVVLIQDADLEYDINDYDALIAPLMEYKRNFVMGSRHNTEGRGRENNWKIRQFSDSPGLAAYFNLGHVFFLALFNWLYSQRLTDPFTMFKVFRRECLYGLVFVCSRFDFDFELVIKLLRKGYNPLELPVNYRSRSIKEGKKITLFGDPLRLLRTLLRFRKSPLYADISRLRN